MLIAGFSDTESLGKRIARALKADYTKISAKDFPDGEFHVQLKKNPKHNTVVIISSLTGDPDEKIIETILAGGIAKDYGAKKVILVATYLPYMRQDRHFKKYDSFSAKHIIKLFGIFDRIYAVDPHLHRIARLNRLSHKAEKIGVIRLIADFLEKKYKGEFNIVGPDEESSQWSSEVAKILKKKVIILKKKRFSSWRVKIAEKPLGKRIIIIDDIISTGKTLAEALKMAKKQGAEKIICIGIHGILVKGAAEKITKYAELITTNSIPNKYAKIDISPAIADVLKKYR